jgi:hypothetical protein
MDGHSQAPQLPADPGCSPLRSSRLNSPFLWANSLIVASEIGAFPPPGAPAQLVPFPLAAGHSRPGLATAAVIPL